MAVTLYRCFRCQGTFSSVFGVGGKNYCRNCRFNLDRPYVPGEQGSGGVPSGGGVTIIESEEETVGGGKASSAIGGPIGDAQNVFAQQQQSIGALQQNALAQANIQNLLGQAGQQAFSGGSEIRSPFQYSVPDNPDYRFKFVGVNPAEGKIYDQQRGTFWERQNDGTYVEYDGNGKALNIGMMMRGPNSIPLPVAKPEPESSPHDAILKPSRKLKLAAE